MITNIIEGLKKISPSFSLEPFASVIQLIINEALIEHKKDKYRKGTILTPLIMVWLILSLTLRRDINYPKTLNWMISGLRWKTICLQLKVVKDGAISHARVKLGVDLFRDIFLKFVQTFNKISPDFYGFITVLFDGTTMTMPDTESNCNKFNKHKSGRGVSAFPQVRVVALLVMSIRMVFDVMYAPIKGKKTGEKSLMFEILKRCTNKMFLFLFDAGFYSFFLIWYMKEHGLNFIMKVSKSIKLTPIPGSQMADGSYLSRIVGKIEDVSGSSNGRNKWKDVEVVVRVIIFQIPGFRPVRLITSILDTKITAKVIVIHYHKRWDIEITYDEIKTHQCATLKGQTPTVLRSKRSDLIEQELYAILIMYNLIRSIITQSTIKEGINPVLISFLDVIQIIIDYAPIISVERELKRKKAFNYLLLLIRESTIDRPRRPRTNPRVVKVKMSNFKRKRETDKSEYRNFEDDTRIIPYEEVA